MHVPKPWSIWERRTQWALKWSKFHCALTAYGIGGPKWYLLHGRNGWKYVGYMGGSSSSNNNSTHSRRCDRKKNCSRKLAGRIVIFIKIYRQWASWRERALGTSTIILNLIYLFVILVGMCFLIEQKSICCAIAIAVSTITCTAIATQWEYCNP